MNFSIKHLTTIYFRGFGQIMLQENAITGLLFVVGIGLNSLVMFVGGVAGALVGILTARLLRCDEVSLRSGLYGFNAALVGIAVFFFHPPNLPSCLLLIAGAALSSILMWLALTRVPKLSPLTAPFVLAAWVTLGLAGALGVDSVQGSGLALADGDFFAIFRGVGQVMFQEYWVTGALFVLGLFVHSRNAATWAFIGSCMGLFFSRAFGFPEDLVALGVYGFNASLVGIALSTRFGREVFPILLGVFLSVILTRAFDLTALPALTAPFVLATWTVSALIRVNSQAIKDI